MSEEKNTCKICGGVKRVDWTISFEECHPVEMRFDPASLAGNWRLCPGHPEPAPKHDGNLDRDGDAKVQYGAAYPGESGVYIIDTTDDDDVYLGAEQALSLLAWLKQEESELQRLAKEQHHAAT